MAWLRMGPWILETQPESEQSKDKGRGGSASWHQAFSPRCQLIC